MLSLEMDWIYKEEQHTDKLGTDKLAIYNQVLKEQVQDLEEQKFALMEHPRFQPLLRYSSLFGNRNINLPMEKKQLEEMLWTIKRSITNLKGNKALEEVENIIQVIDRSAWHDDFLKNMNWE